MKNQEGQTPIELAAADDVKCLLQDAMTSSISQQQQLALTSSSSTSLISVQQPSSSSSTQQQHQHQSSLESPTNSTNTTPITETVTLPTGALLSLSVPIPQLPNRGFICPAQGAESLAEAVAQELITKESISNVKSFLDNLQLDHLIELFEREEITLEILSEMGHDDLKQIGVTAFGYRHKILKGITQLNQASGVVANPGTLLVDLLPDDKEFLAVEEEMQATIREHRDNGQAGGMFIRYNIVKVSGITL